MHFKRIITMNERKPTSNWVVRKVEEITENGEEKQKEKFLKI